MNPTLVSFRCSYWTAENKTAAIHRGWQAAQHSYRWSHPHLTSHRLNIKSPLKHLLRACVRRARRSVCRAASGIPPARAAGGAGRGRSGHSPVRGRRGPRPPCAGCVCAGAGRQGVLQPPATRAACERAIACRSPRASACVQTHARQSIASGAYCELDQKLQACMHVRESPHQPQCGV